MPIHSRPHLTTHNRDKNQSAVAAAAYRMGLRLLDRRTHTWHDYTKRAAGEEVVAAFTVAPPNAPAWVNDPDELWNRVEECEKRRDAQICRDYVVPIPLGLGDAQARELATRLARYISDQHHTAVSVGVHRDAETDLFGNVKPTDKQGFHAHLLFPTRELAMAGGSAAESALGFGKKLSVLSNRRTSSGLVELMNREWAALSNELMAEAGLTADYDHRSYARLGIDRVPMPKLSKSAVAMERAGFFTRQGDRVRDIIASTEVYKQTHAAELEGQHAQALADMVREAVEPPSTAAAGQVAPRTEAPVAEGNAGLAGLDQDLAAARQRGLDPTAPLADRFIAQSAMPEDVAGQQRLFSMSGILWLIQRSLAALTKVSEKLAEQRADLERWRRALLDGLDAVDEARAWRKRMEAKAANWSKSHRWHVVSRAAILGTQRGKPAALRGIERELGQARQGVIDRKAANVSLEQSVALHEAMENELIERCSKSTERLAGSLQQLIALDSQSVPTLMAVLSVDERTTVEGILGTGATPRADTIAPMEAPALRLGPPRPRPAR